MSSETEENNENKPASPEAQESQNPDGAEMEEVQPFLIRLPDDPNSSGDWYLWAGVLALLALVSFWPAISENFGWEDNHTVTRNPALADFAGFKHIWASPIETIDYAPLKYSLLWIEHHFWAPAPQTGATESAIGYRVVNLILHAGAAMVLWRLLRRLGLRGAWAAAAIWAVHPLQAEAVCWISQQGTLLSGLLVLSSVLFYMEFAGLRDPGAPGGRLVWMLNDPWQAYGISLVLFAGAVLSQTGACVIPLAIVALLWWKGRANMQTLTALAPFVLLAVLIGGLSAAWSGDPTGLVAMLGPDYTATIPQRFLIAATDVWFYVSKLFVPYPLSINYPRTIPSPAIGGIALLGILAIVGLLFTLRGKIGRGPITAILCFLIALLPFLSFVYLPVFVYSFVADHFQYLAGISLIALVVGALGQLAPAAAITAPKPASDNAPPAEEEIRPPAPVLAWTALVAAVLVALAITSRARAGAFQAIPPMWHDVLDHYPNSWVAAYYYGLAEFDESNQLLEQAGVALANDQGPTSEADANLAFAELDDARQKFQQVIDDPSAPGPVRYRSYDNIGRILITQTRLPSANKPALLTAAAEALHHAIDGETPYHDQFPDPEPYYNMGVVYQAQADQLDAPASRPSTAPTTEASATTEPAATEPAMPEMALLPADIVPSAAASEPSVAATQPDLSATTMPTTNPSVASSQPSTRPPTAHEQQIIDKLELTRDYWQKAIDAALVVIKETSADRYFDRTRAIDLLALVSRQRGRVDWRLGGMAARRYDLHGLTAYTNAALDDFSLSLKVDPRNYEAQFKVAQAEEQFGQYDEAYKHLENAMILEPRNPEVYDEIGRVLAAEATIMRSFDDLNKAIMAFQEAIDLNPNFADAKANLVKAHLVMASSRPVATEPSATNPSSTTRPPGP